MFDQKLKNEIAIQKRFFQREVAQRFALPDRRAGWETESEAKKVEARKLFKNAADSRRSGARFVGWHC